MNKLLTIVMVLCLGFLIGCYDVENSQPKEPRFVDINVTVDEYLREASWWCSGFNVNLELAASSRDGVFFRELWKPTVFTWLAQNQFNSNGAISFGFERNSANPNPFQAIGVQFVFAHPGGFTNDQLELLEKLVKGYFPWMPDAEVSEFVFDIIDPGVVNREFDVIDSENNTWNYKFVTGCIDAQTQCAHFTGVITKFSGLNKIPMGY